MSVTLIVLRGPLKYYLIDVENDGLFCAAVRQIWVEGRPGKRS